MYLDTAIIVKLLIPESDSEFFRDALEEETVSSSELSSVEVRAALLAKERDRKLTPAQRRLAWSVFEEKVRDDALPLHPLDSAVLKKARHVLDLCHPRVPLRTLDAIHVAACDLSQDFPLCTTDARMRAAAGRLGIPVFPETLPN